MMHDISTFRLYLGHVPAHSWDSGSKFGLASSTTRTHGP